VRRGARVRRVCVEPRLAPLLLQPEPSVAPTAQRPRHVGVSRWRCARMPFLAWPCATVSAPVAPSSSFRTRHASHGFCPWRSVCDGLVKAPTPAWSVVGSVSQRRCRRGSRTSGRRVTLHDWRHRGDESTVSDAPPFASSTNGCVCGCDRQHAPRTITMHSADARHGMQWVVTSTHASIVPH